MKANLDAKVWFAAINGWAEAIHYLMSNPDPAQRPNIDYMQGYVFIFR
jgi:hypothetical protein